MNHFFLYSQILVGIATVFDLLSFQLKDRTHITLCFTISCILIASHFALLNNWTAMCLVAISAVRCACSIMITSKRVMSFFVLLYVIAAILTFNGFLSVLSCAGSVLGTLGTFCKSDKRLREIVLLGSILWLIHNVFAGSPVAVIMETIFIGSNVIGYFRFYPLIRKRPISE